MPPAEVFDKAPVTVRHHLEYGLARATLGLVEAIPLRLAAGMACHVARIFFQFSRRRRIAIDNILRAGITPDFRTATRIARASFEHFALTLVESARCDFLFRNDTWKQHVAINLPSEVNAILDDPSQGMILGCGHYGNWEVAGQIMALRKPLVGVSRPMSNPLTQDLLRVRRPQVRMRLIPKHDGDLLRFLGILKNHEILALMMDQHSGSRGLAIPFFGTPAGTHTAIALLHLVTRTPLVFGVCRRVGLMQFELTASGPLQYTATGNKTEDIRAILMWLNTCLEQAIRTAPEQYLWGHRRWKSIA
jgi:KDO2-lipid IV(A) lauroyltransferase